MATEVKSWRSDAGTLHLSEQEATDADLDFLLERCPLTLDATELEGLKQWLIRDREDIFRVMGAYNRARPQARAAASVEKAPLEGQKGPVARSEGPIAGVTVQASEALLDDQGHTGKCGARASGFLRHCNCGALGTDEIRRYREQSADYFGVDGTEKSYGR
jgi:dsDNA-binding SOS-regulon protein